MLKRTVALILAVVLAIAAAGCAANKPKDPAATNAPEETERQEELVNPLVITDENGGLRRIEFTPDEAHRLIQFVSASESGVRAVLMTDDFPLMNASGVIRCWSEK